jgi:hypothetical protein
MNREASFYLFYTTKLIEYNSLYSFNVFGDRPNRVFKEEDLNVKEEVELVKNDLDEENEVVEEKITSAEVVEQRKGPRWI